MKDLQKDRWIGESDDIVTYIEVSFPCRALLPYRAGSCLWCAPIWQRVIGTWPAYAKYFANY